MYSMKRALVGVRALQKKREKNIPFSGPNIKYIRSLITTIRDENMPQKCTLKQKHLKTNDEHA